MLKCGRSELKAIFKTSLLSGGMLLLPILSFAQGGDLPCGGDDPTTSNPCPLDSWVWVLAVLAGVFGAAYLYSRQKVAKKL